MYFDNFVGLDCVDDGLNMDVGTGVVFFSFIIIKFRTVPAVPGSTLLPCTALSSGTDMIDVGPHGPRHASSF